MTYIDRVWLYGSGAGISCMSLKAFPKHLQPPRILGPLRSDTGATGKPLILMGDYF